MNDTRVTSDTNQKEILLSPHDELGCPACGGSGLHQRHVSASQRASEDADGFTYDIHHTTGPLAPRVTVAESFLGRRDQIEVGFTCEGCPACPTLVIRQHKGSTLVYWA